MSAKLTKAQAEVLQILAAHSGSDGMWTRKIADQTGSPDEYGRLRLLLKRDLVENTISGGHWRITDTGRAALANPPVSGGRGS